MPKILTLVFPRKMGNLLRWMICHNSSRQLFFSHDRYCVKKGFSNPSKTKDIFVKVIKGNIRDIWF